MSNSRTSRRPSVLALALAAVGLLAGVFLLVGAARLGAWVRPPAFYGTAWEPSETAAEFRLTDHSGRDASLGDFRGKAVLLFFGYANCPHVCPLTLARLERVLSAMDADTADVRVLLVTVDPERDTPETLARYVARFSPWVTGLTGDADSLAAVRKRYYVYAEPAPPAVPGGRADHGEHHPVAADLNHTPQVFGIDRKGEIRVLLPMERPEEEIESDIRTLLRF